jgi:hypothetical protein
VLVKVPVTRNGPIGYVPGPDPPEGGASRKCSHFGRKSLASTRSVRRAPMMPSMISTTVRAARSGLGAAGDRQGGDGRNRPRRSARAVIESSLERHGLASSDLSESLHAGRRIGSSRTNPSQLPQAAGPCSRCQRHRSRIGHGGSALSVTRCVAEATTAPSWQLSRQ